MEGIRLSGELVHAAEIVAERAAQGCLVRLPLCREDDFRFLGTDLFRRERKVRLHQFPHPFPETVQFLGCRLDRQAGAVVEELAVHAACQGVFDPQVPVREQRPGRMLQDKTQGTDVRSPSVGVIVADESDFVRIENIETELLELVVHQGGQDRVTLLRLFVLYLGADALRESQEGGSFFHRTETAVVLQKYLNHDTQSYEIERIFHIFVFPTCVISFI